MIVLVTQKDHPVLQAATQGLTSCVHSVTGSLGPAMVHLVMSLTQGRNKPCLKAKNLGCRAWEVAVLKIRAT